VEVEKVLSDLTGFPVKAGNDASVAALGESWVGGKECENMVFVTLGTGVGGGIVVEGKLLFGAHGAGGEIGHMVMNPLETIPCSCGNYGCLEQYGSATGIVRLAKEALAKTEAPSSLRNVEKLTCKDVFDAAKAEDTLAQEVLEQVYAYLGAAIANICNTVDPDAVVIGGGVSKAGQLLLDGIERHFKRHVFHAVAPVEFRLAQLGNDAGAYGACKLILQ
jgi:glucokinase